MLMLFEVHVDFEQGQMGRYFVRGGELRLGRQRNGVLFSVVEQECDNSPHELTRLREPLGL